MTYKQRFQKKIDIWPKAGSTTRALGHKFASLQTLNKRFFPVLINVICSWNEKKKLGQNYLCKIIYLTL